MKTVKAVLVFAVLCLAPLAFASQILPLSDTDSYTVDQSVTSQSSFNGIAISGEASEKTETTEPVTLLALSNPAADYCVETGGNYQTRTGDAGAYGVCVLADGSEIDAWEYFRLQQIANPAAIFCIESDGTYTMRNTDNGTAGTCRLADGTEIDAWEYFRNNTN